MEYDAEWWKKIEKKRKKYRITQDRFAVHIGISREHYNRLKANKVELTLSLKEKIENT